MALGDRREAVRVRNASFFHRLMSHLFPCCCDSVAFIRETFDMTEVKAYLKSVNEAHPETHYTIFQVFLAAFAHIGVHFPRINRFIHHRTMFQRGDVSIAFVAKKQMTADAGEGFVLASFGGEDTLETVREVITGRIKAVKEDKDEDAQGVVNFIGGMPNFIIGFIVSILSLLDRFGRLPKALDAVDPNHAGIFIANLASVGIDAPFHHLNEWGTTSVFICIGGMHKAPWVDQDTGALDVRDVVNMAFTIDERVADGFYFAQCIKMLRHLLKHPELLERPAKEGFAYD